jgi:hypothetical protein
MENYDGSESLKVSKISPVFALGIEKSLCNKFSSRFDIEYRMKTDKTSNQYKLEGTQSINMRFAFIYYAKF